MQYLAQASLITPEVSLALPMFPVLDSYSGTLSWRACPSPSLCPALSSSLFFSLSLSISLCLSLCVTLSLSLSLSDSPCLSQLSLYLYLLFLLLPLALCVCIWPFCLSLSISIYRSLLRFGRPLVRLFPLSMCLSPPLLESFLCLAVQVSSNLARYRCW